MNPTYAIVDGDFPGENIEGLAARWLWWELKQAGVERVTPAKADFILATICSGKKLPTLKRKLRKTRADSKIIIGGAACYTPVMFDDFADVCCVGDGPNFIRTLTEKGFDEATALPEAWIPGETRTVIPSPEFPWEMPPIKRSGDGALQYFCSRGCNHGRCLFCGEGWTREFVSNPNMAKVIQQARKCQKYKIPYVIGTNDGGDEDPALLRGIKGLSMRLDSINKLLDEGTLAGSNVKSVRIGVEGISERIRRAIGKPVGSEDLIETSFRLVQQKMSVFWYFIVGFPGEQQADYEEFKDFIRRLQTVDRSVKGSFMSLPHAFIPHPATPLSIFPLEDIYYERFQDVHRHWGYGTCFGPRIILRHTMYPTTRLKTAKLDMGASEMELYEGWWEKDNPNWRVQYLASPARLRAMARAYARNMGMEIPAKVGV